VAAFRYAQFCPIARCSELLAERWTLLLLRELFVGPQRFSDLRRRLPGLSSSVLAQRLAALEERGLIRQRALPPPAASRVYELDEHGRALWPVMAEMVRWGMRFLLPAVPGDQLEPEWVPLGLRAIARRGVSPAVRIDVALASDDAPDLCCRVAGGSGGTRVEVTSRAAPCDARLRAAPLQVLGFATGLADPGQAARNGSLEYEGELRALEKFPALFEMEPVAGAAPDPQPPQGD